MSKFPAAYYAQGRSGLRAWWTLLHPPYTLMHLSFVVVGAALAPELNLRNLIATLLAFFLAVGIAAHALDELAGRPLGTTISRAALIAAAAGGLGAAAAMGFIGVFLSDFHIIWFVIAGVFLAVSYNLELFGGIFHTDLWFGLAWGAFPALTANFAQTGTITLLALLGAGYALAISLTQRQLSTPARRLRRRVDSVAGTLSFRDGTTIHIDRELLLKPLERALRLLVAASLLIAAALLAMRLLRGEWITGF
jgi:uncharacterized membrane protein YccF (DUF307 family)